MYHINYRICGPIYGSIWAHIKTGRSPMAQDHFETPPDPKRTHIRPNKSQNGLKVRAKPAKLLCQFCSLGLWSCWRHGQWRCWHRQGQEGDAAKEWTWMSLQSLYIAPQSAACFCQQEHVHLGTWQCGQWASWVASVSQLGRMQSF